MRLFISFDWDDRDQVNGFRGMLANPSVDELTHRDVSVKHDYTEFGNAEIKRQILRRIQNSQVTVCLISQKTRNSGWVNWELEQSRLEQLGIVGVVLPGQRVATEQGIPEFFRRYPRYAVYQWGSPAEIDAWIQTAWRNR